MRYLRDGTFWLSVDIVNLALSPFVGVGRALADRWLP